MLADHERKLRRPTFEYPGERERHGPSAPNVAAQRFPERRAIAESLRIVARGFKAPRLRGQRAARLSACTNPLSDHERDARGGSGACAAAGRELFCRLVAGEEGRGR